MLAVVVQCRVFCVLVIQALVVTVVVVVESAQGRNGAFVKLFIVFVGDLGVVSVKLLGSACTVKLGGEEGVMGLVTMALVGAVVITVRG